MFLMRQKQHLLKSGVFCLTKGSCKNTGTLLNMYGTMLCFGYTLMRLTFYITKKTNKFVLKIGPILGKQAALYNTPPV